MRVSRGAHAPVSAGGRVDGALAARIHLGTGGRAGVAGTTGSGTESRPVVMAALSPPRPRSALDSVSRAARNPAGTGLPTAIPPGSDTARQRHACPPWTHRGPRRLL